MRRTKIADPDNPEWTREKMARSMRFKDLPAELQAKLSAIQEASRKKRGPQKAPKKVPISIRISADVAEGLRATGAGWQRRADEALRAQFVKAKS